MGTTAYWVNTVSRDHVRRGVAGGFTRANHGKPHMLREMSRADRIVFYSPRTDYPHGAAVQAFTAIGQITDDEAYREELAGDLHRFRFGVFAVEEPDFDLIRAAMAPVGVQPHFA